MKKIVTLLILAGVIFAQDLGDLSSSDAVAETQDVEATIEKYPEDFLRESITASLAKKGKALGTINSDGSVYVIGSATTGVPSNASGFIASRNAAFSVAVLSAKINFLRLSGEQITSSRNVSSMENLVEGSDPDAVAKASKLKKASMIVDKNLDKALQELGVSQAEISRMNTGKKEAIYSQKFFEQTQSLVAGLLRGVSVVRIAEGESGNRDYQVSVVVKYSPEFQYLASTIMNNAEYQLDPKEPSAALDRIKNAPDDELISRLGTSIVLDDNGRMVVLGYGQQVVRNTLTRQSSAKSRAREKARLQAVTNIKNFISEDLVGDELFQQSEKISEYVDGSQQYFSQELWKNSIESKSSTMTIPSYNFRVWNAIHPESQQKIVGVIVAWTPEFAAQSKQMKELLTKPNSALLDSQNSSKKDSKSLDENTKKGKIRISGEDDEL